MLIMMEIKSHSHIAGGDKKWYNRAKKKTVWPFLIKLNIELLSVQFSAQSCPTLCYPMNHSTLGLPIHHQLWSLPKPMSIEPVMPSNDRILCCPLLLLPSIFLSITIFSNESVLCIRWPKYSSFIFSISPSIEYSGLISFRMDWFDLLAVQRTLKSLLQDRKSTRLNSSH